MRNKIAAFAAVLALSCPAWATVTGNPPPAVYTCTGGTSFTIPFPYLSPTHVVATKTTGTVATVVAGTVKPSVAPTSGTLTLLAACPSGSSLTITRVVPLTQPTPFRTGPYSGSAHEQAFDRLEMQVQQNAATHAADKATQAAKDATQDAALSQGAVGGNSTLVTATGGTAARSLADRFSDVINVKDRGATGDGATDDTAAIQAAVTAGAAAGKPIVVPPGTYMVNIVSSGGALGFDDATDSGGVKVPSNGHLIIQAGATLKAITSSWYAGRVLRVMGATNVTIEGPGTIRGDRLTHDFTNASVPSSPDRRTQEWNFGILVRNSSDVTIRGLTIVDHTGDAIEVGDDSANNTNRVRIVNCRLDNSRRNNISVVTRSVDVQIVGNVITNGGANVGTVSGTPPRSGIDVEGGTISAGTAPLNTIIANNEFRANWNSSVSLFNAIGSTVIGNFSDNSIGYGFSVDSTIQGNTLREATALVPANFAAWSSTTTYVKGDRVQNAGAFYTSLLDANLNNAPPNATWWQVYTPVAAIYGLGVAASMDTNSATITGNTVSGFNTGIDLRGANAIAIGNHIYKPRTIGLNAFSIVGATFADNEVFQAPTGVNLDTTATQATVSGNYIEAATTTGIMSLSTSAIIRGNRIRFTPTGIRVTGGTAEISDNKIRPEGVTSESNPISISGASTVAFVKGNTVRNSTNTALLASGAPTLRVVGNEFTGCTTAGFAVSITSTARVEVIDNIISFARASNGGTGLGLLGGTTGTLVLSNKIYTENAFTLTNPIITTASAGSNKVVNNITSTGTVTLHATDTNTGNVTY